MPKVDLKKRFLHQFQTLPNALQKQPLFIAVSAGQDSTVLAKVALSLKDRLPPIHFIHVNYHLRTPQSDREEEFLQTWAQQEKISIFVKRIFPKQKPKDLQNWARQQRYQFFAQTLAKKFNGKGLILLAHHQRDQAETILARLLRGSGLQGLGGMKTLEAFKTMPGIKLSHAFRVFRPFLEVPYEAIVDYAKRHRIKFFKDQSNLSLDYLRNRLRNKILPLLKKENPKIETVLSDLGQRTSQAHETLSELALKWIKKYQTKKAKGVSLPLTKIQKLSPALQDSVLQLFLTQNLSPPQAWGEILKAMKKYIKHPQGVQQMPLKRKMILQYNREALQLIVPSSKGRRT